MRWWRVPVPPRPRRSCKDQLHPCALPVMVSRVSAALTSPAFQTDAFTGLASWTASCTMRNFAIWRGPAESNRYQCAGSAWHSQYTRSANFDGHLRISFAIAKSAGGWWVTAESNRACAQAQALQAHSVTRLGVTLKYLETSRRTEGLCWRSGAAIFDHHPWQP